jgi:hypothetical protein
MVRHMCTSGKALAQKLLTHRLSFSSRPVWARRRPSHIAWARRWASCFPQPRAHDRDVVKAS